MVRLRSFIRSVIVANLLLAGLLFPALHVHFIGDHGHESHEIHRHGIVHAHFLVALADNQQPGMHHDEIASHEHGNEVALLALTSHKVNGSDQPFHKQLYYLADQQRGLVIAAISRDSRQAGPPPHVQSFIISALLVLRLDSPSFSLF
jgi:hypothetical protein